MFTRSSGHFCVGVVVYTSTGRWSGHTGVVLSRPNLRWKDYPLWHSLESLTDWSVGVHKGTLSVLEESAP